MRPIAFVILALCAACGAKRVASVPCEPVPAEFQVTGPVFRDCAVDRKAQPPAVLPAIRPVDLPTTQTGCSKVVIDMVVDTLGIPNRNTAKVVSSNDPRFQVLILSQLGALRYTPAVKEGVRVRQLVRYERKMQFATMVVAVSGPTAPVPRPTRSSVPPC